MRTCCVHLPESEVVPHGLAQAHNTELQVSVPVLPLSNFVVNTLRPHQPSTPVVNPGSWKCAPAAGNRPLLYASHIAIGLICVPSVCIRSVRLHSLLMEQSLAQWCGLVLYPTLFASISDGLGLAMASEVKYCPRMLAEA